MPADKLPITPDSPWLAPMAGFTDLPFRLMCRGYGCKVACTEMISAKGLLYGNKGTRDLLHTCPDDVPLVVQLFGSNPEIVAKAAFNLKKEHFVFFDFNCGCSVKKVTKTGSGAALLLDQKRLFNIARELIAVCGEKMVGFKLRLGWDIAHTAFLDIALGLEQLGAGWITLHPRYAVQKFSGHADWSALCTLKKRLNIPLIASGDLITAENAMRCLEQTNVDTVMFARGALYDPLIFTKMLIMMNKDEHESTPLPDLPSVLAELINVYRKWSPEKKSLLKLRTLGPKIIRELPGAGAFRKQACLCRNWNDMSVLIKELQDQSSHGEDKLSDDNQQKNEK